MTPREQEILILIREDPLITQAALASRLGISRSAVAGHIMNLTAKGAIRGRGYVVVEDPFVVVVGGANMDICASSSALLRMGDSNPGTVTTSPGGVARNIAENLARLGVECRLISAVGADHHGDLLLQQGCAAGIDMNAVLRVDDAPTSTYVSMLDDSGDMHVAVNDMSVIETLQPDRMRSHEKMLRHAQMIVLDTNLPQDTLAYLCNQPGDRPLFVDAVSAAKAPRILPFLSAVHTLKTGRIEAEAICGLRCHTERQLEKATRWFLDQGTKNIVITLGDNGVYYGDHEKSGLEPVPKGQSDLKNANGAGDAFFAGLAYGWLEHWPFVDTMRFAMSAAGLTMAHQSTINPDLSRVLVKKHQARLYA